MALYEWQHLRSSSFLSLSYTQRIGIIALFPVLVEGRHEDGEQVESSTVRG